MIIKHIMILQPIIIEYWTAFASKIIHVNNAICFLKDEDLHISDPNTQI